MVRSILIKIDGQGNETVDGPFAPMEARKRFHHGDFPGIAEVQWVNTLGGLHKTRRFNLNKQPKPEPKPEPVEAIKEEPKRKKRS